MHRVGGPVLPIPYYAAVCAGEGGRALGVCTRRATAKWQCLQQLEASTKYSPSDPDNFINIVLMVEKAIH